MLLKRRSHGIPSEAWQVRSTAYRQLIADPDRDSKVLREAGLFPTVLEMVGECDCATVLDAGTGTGWLFAHIRPKEAHACDIVCPANLPPEVRFRQDDVSALSYESGTFDIIVASLLLIYCKDLVSACRELRRVAKPVGAKLVVALMHPYFYRTGLVADDGSFSVTQDLSKSTSFPLKIAEKVGPFEYFYRPLPDYFNALIEAGWAIVGAKDWFIDMSVYSKPRSSSVRRSGFVPLFTFLKCCTRETS